jgi:hypothetical protein
MTELLDTDFYSTVAVRHAQLGHLLVAAAVYVFVLLAVIGPLLIRSYRRGLAMTWTASTVRTVRTLLFFSVFASACGTLCFVTGHEGALIMLLLVAALGCSAFASTYGSRPGLILAIIEALVPPLATILLAK